MSIARFRSQCCPWLAATFLVIGLGQSPLVGSGCHDVPSDPAQFFGYGYGPGYHAPIVKAPCHRPPRMARYISAPCYPAAPFGPACTVAPGCLAPSGACPSCRPAAPSPTLADPAPQEEQPTPAVPPQVPGTPPAPQPAETEADHGLDPAPASPVTRAARPATAEHVATIDFSHSLASEGLSPRSTALTMGDLFCPPRLTSSVDLDGLDAYQVWADGAQD